MFYKKGKIYSIELKDGLFALLISLFYVALLVPIYRLALYATPYYDDFNYAYYVKEARMNEPTLASVLKGAWTAMTWTWQTWQGTYSSVFMMSLMPATYGNQYYFIGVFAVLTMLVAGSVYLAYSVARKVFKACKAVSLSMAVLFSILIVENLYAPQQGLFWYNASVHYTFMSGLLMLWLGCMVRLLLADKFKAVLCVLCSLLSFLLAGANYITALQGLLLAICFLIAGWILKKNPFWMIAPTIFWLGGFLINVLAPGNVNREVLYADVAKGPIEAIFRSILAGFSYLFEFFGVILIAYLIVLVPVILKLLKNVTFSFAYPGLVTAAAFLFYCTGFVAGYYGMGYAGLARMFAAVKIMFLLMVTVVEFYWIGWLRYKNRFRENELWDGHHYVLVYLGCLVMIGVCVAFSKAKVEAALSYGSYYYVHTGEAQCYYNEYNNRVQTIENGGDYVEVEPFVYRPWFLCQQKDLDTDYEAEQNRAMAKWYQKAGIALKSEE